MVVCGSVWKCVVMCVCVYVEVLVCGNCGVYLAQKKLRVEFVGWVLVATLLTNTPYCVCQCGTCDGVCMSVWYM